MKPKHKLDNYPKMKLGLFSIKRFIGIFFLLGFAITCSFLLFLSGLEMPEQYVRERAVDTFVNIIMISAVLTVLDLIRRRATIERPVMKILDATQRLSEGDFSVRIKTRKFVKPRNELDIIINNFNILAEELAGTETLKTSFIADVSHELKTPIAVISNYAELLKSPDLTEEERLEYTRELTYALNRLSDLVTNILKLNKLENQQIIPDIKRFNLSQQLCECLFAFENEIEKKNLQVEADIEENVYIEADPDILSIVWNNLISNAIKFNKNEGKLVVTLKVNSGYVLVAVSDTGCGISKETGKHIFDKFYQGDKSHSSQGNGLGLALVKRIVDIIGCEIFVESEVDRGSTFTIKLKQSTQTGNL